MRKLIASLNITADGYCDHTTAIADEELHRRSLELMDNASMIVLGRSTYGLFESFWPGALVDTTQPKVMLEFAQKINAIRKVVVSKTLSHADWQNSIVISDLRKLDLLKKEPGKNLLIFGSPGLVSVLSKRRMIDEYHFFVQPILAGRGKRLFGDVVPEERINLVLTETNTFKSGVVVMTYSVA